MKKGTDKTETAGMASMLNGVLCGVVDSNKVTIKCGDVVEYYEFKEGYTERHAQDGWGRTVALCRHDQYKVPDKEKTIRGKVVYSAKFTGFIVEFEDYMLDSGRKDQNLYMLLNSGKCRLTVVAT